MERRREPSEETVKDFCPQLYTVGEPQKYYCKLTRNLCVGNKEGQDFEGLLSITTVKECLTNPKF